MEMGNAELIDECKSCGYSGTGNYCNRCGQPYKINKITIATLLHDVFHLFTHLDKGFGYTVKKLIISPGHMQRLYVEGERAKHQKPFSMFFICATIAALSRYWIYTALMTYFDTGNISEVQFFHDYMVMIQILLLPVYTLLIYILFYKSDYNYAEIGVLALYSISFFFIIATAVALFKFIWHEFDTAYFELPILMIYNTITFVNFFYKQPRWKVALNSVVIISVIFFLVQMVEDFVVKIIS